MTKQLIIIGGEGNGGVVASCIEDMNVNYNLDTYKVSGFINDYHSGQICGYPVLGKTKDIKDFIEEGFYFSFAVHPIGHGSIREELFNKLAIPDSLLATIIHPRAFVSQSCAIEPGTFVMANCYIGPQTTIARSSFIMANCVIGHNDYIAPLCHISAGATVSSYVKTGVASDICLATSVLEKVTIGKYCVIGAHSLLTKSTADSEMYIGVPAKLHRKIERKDYCLKEG